MIKHSFDVAIIGAGPAGLAAAISAKKNGVKDVLVIDRNRWVGGILPQCIHDGFGIEETKESMTGPEYAEMYYGDAIRNEIIFQRDTMVLEFAKNHEITAVNKKGLHKILAKSIVLATGCREKTRWHAMIPGDRPSGIYTAGLAQALINLYNIMPGKNVIILGSGDVGLIMARRLKLEGASVRGVIEILPYPTGLPRNVVQCLDDYEIPLFLNHTITCIKGKGRLESVTIGQVDKNYDIIPNTERVMECDTLLLSLGLIPENELCMAAGVEMDEATHGPLIDQNFETSLTGVFACGNCLQVYDTVDLLSMGAKIAGRNAARHAINDNSINKTKIHIKKGEKIANITPQRISSGGLVNFSFRVTEPMRTAVFNLLADDKYVFNKKLKWLNPANMNLIAVDIPEDLIKSTKSFEAIINGK